MARTKDKVIEPSDAPSGKSESISIFTDASWSPEDARWLGSLCFSALRSQGNDEPGLDWVTEHNLKIIASSWPDSGPPGSRDRALLVAYARLCGCSGRKGQLAQRTKASSDKAPQRPPMGLTEWKEIAKTFRSHGANFEAAIVDGGWPGEYGNDHELNGVLMEFVRDGPHSFYGAPEIVRLMQVLADGADLDLTKVIDASALVEIGSQRMANDQAKRLRVPKEINRTRPPIAEARSLTNWMIGLGPRALTLFYPTFKSCTNDGNLAAMATGVRDAIEHWLMCGTGHYTYFREGGLRLAEGSQPYFEELERRCSSNDDPELRRCWLWFAWCTFDADPNRLKPDRRERILRAANEDVARLRPLFARAKPKSTHCAVMGQDGLFLGHGESLEPWEEFAWEHDHFQTCVILLFRFGGVWRGMKPMLLALRALSAPAVAPDLRYWIEPGRTPPPEPWCDVVAWMINLFHNRVGKEQATDRDLIELRGHLAAFCLERLVDRWSKQERSAAAKARRNRANEDIVERSPEWRLCLIRAFNSLGLNPEAKGHRTLHTSSQIDPDPDVREAASEAYQRVRRGMALPDGVSPRRAVMSALWWIRQAHLLGLGIQPDADGAQRTRTKELTRTKETEQVDNPARRTKK
ncbi:MAG: hypothetical protein L0219_16760 [Phycisphaerales bacterium]|nr:hypothetical protein [Phycisphaerales bacterium]